MPRSKMPIHVSSVKGKVNGGPLNVTAVMEVKDGPRLVIGHPVIARFTRTDLHRLLRGIPQSEIPADVYRNMLPVMMWLKDGTVPDANTE